MTNSNLITELIISLNVNSVKDRYNALLEFITLYPGELDTDDVKRLISNFKQSREAKVEQGKKDAAKRWHKKNGTKVNTSAQWIFLKNSRFGARCTKCDNRYEIGDSVFVDKNGNKGFHIECTPEEVKDGTLEGAEECFIHYKKFCETK